MNKKILISIVVILLLLVGLFTPIPYYQKSEVCTESNPPQCSPKGWYLKSSLWQSLFPQTASYHVSAEPLTVTDQANVQSPMSLTISFNSLPQKGQEVQFVASASSKIAAPNTSIIIELPSNISIIEGDTHWQGDLVANEHKDMKLILRFPEDGNFEFTVNALSRPKPSEYFRFGREKKLCVKLTDSITTIEDGSCTKYVSNPNQTAQQSTPSSNEVIRPSYYDPLGKKGKQ